MNDDGGGVPTNSESDLTRLLNGRRDGDESAYARGMEKVYAELRRRAAVRLRRESGGGSVSPTEIVHEVYLRLAKQHVVWQNRGHFLAVASEMMRRVLVDQARARQAFKRDGIRVDLTEDIAHVGQRNPDLLALDAALTELGRVDPRQARLVELRYFAGLSMEEAAASESISLATANRDWRFARAWLQRRLQVETRTAGGPHVEGRRGHR